MSYELREKSVAIILINYKDYAEKYLAECFSSLRKQDYKGQLKIFIVDNETSEGSNNVIKTIVETLHATSLRAPETELILNKTNDGFAKGNNDAMRLAMAQGFEYIILFNMDTVVAPDCVSEMVKVAETTNNQDTTLPTGRQVTKKITNYKLQITNLPIGAVQARLMMYDKDLTLTLSSRPGEGVINSLGNVTHFLGFGYCEGYGEKYSRPHPDPLLQTRRGESICYPSGAAVLFKAEVLKQIGFFDEEYFMYNEDQDLGWRIWLAGYRCVLAPEAVVYHKYEFAKSIKQYYYMDRNRILNMLKYYRFGTFLLILPAFIIMELGLILFSFKSGWFKEKIKVWSYFLKPSTWKYLIRERRWTQGLRRVNDKEIIKMFSGKIWYQEIDDAKLRMVNPIFSWYWNFVKKIVWW